MRPREDSRTKSCKFRVYTRYKMYGEVSVQNARGSVSIQNVRGGPSSSQVNTRRMFSGGHHFSPASRFRAARCTERIVKRTAVRVRLSIFLLSDLFAKRTVQYPDRVQLRFHFGGPLKVASNRSPTVNFAQASARKASQLANSLLLRGRKYGEILVWARGRGRVPWSLEVRLKCANTSQRANCQTHPGARPQSGALL